MQKKDIQRDDCMRKLAKLKINITDSLTMSALEKCFKKL